MNVHFLLGTDLVLEPNLAATMFRDRTDQFHQRLGWDVVVNEIGYERDQYEQENPFYVILSGPNGAHLGSLRLLPTTGPTMIAEHFAECLGGRSFDNDYTWECSRFCVSRNSGPLTSVGLLAVTGRAMRAFGITQLVAVFDEPMIKAYNRIGASPEILGEAERFGGKVFGGLWTYDHKIQAHLEKRAGLDPALIELCLANAPSLHETRSPVAC